MQIRHTIALFGMTLLIGVSTSDLQAQTWRDSLALTHDDGQGNTMPYRLFVPPEHEHDSELPLIVYLHRAAHIGTDNRKHVASHIGGLIQATQGANFPAFLLAPQAPTAWWYGSIWPLTMQLIEEVEQSFSIDSNRIYLTGTSMGGFGITDLVSRHPDRFAAAAPLSAGILTQERTTVRLESEPLVVPEILANTPHWIFHATEDTTNDVEYSKELMSVIQDAGGSPRYTELSGGAVHSSIWHDIYLDRNEELYPWMFSQALEAMAPPLTGDFDADGVLDADDIDLLTHALRGDSPMAIEFDVDANGVVNQVDVDVWIERFARTFYGDANLDGEFDSTDLVSVFQAGEYEDAISMNSTWSTGDWNGDGEFDSGDLAVAFQDGGYQQRGWRGKVWRTELYCQRECFRRVRLGWR